jgi:hypothetical protein
MVAFAKFYPWALINQLAFAVHCESGASPLYPGLEVFHALENASKTSKPIHFMGGVINESTLKALSHEKRMYLIPHLWRLLRLDSNYHRTEINDLYKMISVRGMENMSEHLDDYHMSLLVYNFNKQNPFQKPIMVDQENERLFKHIYEHMEGNFGNLR